MPASQLNITSGHADGRDPGAGRSHLPRLGAGGAGSVHRLEAVRGGSPPASYPKNPGDLLVKDAAGHWTGFVPGLKDGDLYRFYVVGTGSEGFKRDPYARELEFNGYPDCDCILRDPQDYALARRRIPSAALQRSDHLPIPHRRVLREGRRRTGTSGAVASASSWTWWTGSNTGPTSA